MELQIITIVALILSVVLHEMAHAHAANYLGDPTARLQGRLSPNPLVHLDPLGSVLIPGLLVLTGSGLLFGWAKPVPYNPYNLSDQKWGEAKVAAAGPAINIILAIIFSIVVRVAEQAGLPSTFIEISFYIVLINIVLALFNMLPIPPLDGSKILMAFLPFKAKLEYQKVIAFAEQWGFFAMFAFIFIFMQFFADTFFGFVYNVATLMTGLS